MSSDSLCQTYPDTFAFVLEFGGHEQFSTMGYGGFHYSAASVIIDSGQYRTPGRLQLSANGIK